MLVVAPVSLGGLGFGSLSRLSGVSTVGAGLGGWTALFVRFRRGTSRLCVAGILAGESRALGKRGGDLRSLGAEPRRGKRGRLRAGTIGAAIATIAIVEAVHELGAA